MVAVVSDDGGRTFDRDSERVVYAHVDASAPGADGSLSAFDYLMSMDRFTFGHPCGVVTGPNEALVFWYAGGPTRTSIRSARLGSIDGQCPARPPEMSNTAPVENEHSSEDRKATSAATSGGWPTRPTG